MAFVHFIFVFTMFGIPYLIWLPFSLLGYHDLGRAAIGLAGAAGLLFSEVLIRSLEKTHTFISLGRSSMVISNY